MGVRFYEFQALKNEMLERYGHLSERLGILEGINAFIETQELAARLKKRNKWYRRAYRAVRYSRLFRRKAKWD